MVTKAIITEIVDRNQARVRIPIFNKAEGDAFATPNENLAIAPICTMSGSSPNYKVGDVVFVAFEYDVFSQPVILGTLLTDSTLERTSDFNINKLNVISEINLPSSSNTNNFSGSLYDFEVEDNNLHIILSN